jgi:hypothetical protein
VTWYAMTPSMPRWVLRRVGRGSEDPWMRI